MGEATLSFEDNEHINVVNDNGITTTVQIMNERLDRVEDILKSCPLSRTAFPVETNQHLPAKSAIIFNECQMNGHELSKCSPSNNISTCGANQLINSIQQFSLF